MLIAEKKKKECLAEYILYLWQVEDIIRAFNFDLRQIEQKIISKYSVNSETYQQIKDWYADLIEKMITEGIIKQGHLAFTNELVAKINSHHQQLLKSAKSLEYELLYKKHKNDMDEFRVKSNADRDTSDIEICFNALYATLLLRLQKKEISTDTMNAIDGFCKLIVFVTNSMQPKNEV